MLVYLLNLNSWAFVLTDDPGAEFQDGLRSQVELELHVDVLDISAVGFLLSHNSMSLYLFCFKVWLNRGEVRDGALATFEAASHSWESQAGSCQGETTQQHNLPIVVTAPHSRKSTSNRLISTACIPLSFQVKTKMFYNITD